MAVEDDQVHDLAGGLEEPFQDRQCDVAQRAFLWGEESDLPQPRTDGVPSPSGSSQAALLDELRQVAVCCGRRQPACFADLVE